MLCCNPAFTRKHTAAEKCHFVGCTGCCNGEQAPLHLWAWQFHVGGHMQLAACGCPCCRLSAKGTSGRRQIISLDAAGSLRIDRENGTQRFFAHTNRTQLAAHFSEFALLFPSAPCACMCDKRSIHPSRHGQGWVRVCAHVPQETM